MTKKRIADLLKEEVEKSSTAAPSGAKSAPDDSTKASVRKASTAKASAAKPATSKTSASKSISPASASTKAAATKPSAVKGADTQTAPDLAPKVAELEAKLHEALQALQESRDQISALQGDVDTHQSRIFELKDSLEKAENDGNKKDAQIKKLTTDLETAKQTIVNLTDKSRAAAERPASQPVTAERAAAQPSDRASLSVRRSPYASHKSIPEYAIQRGTPPAGQNTSMMSDDDIGWVD